MTSHIPALKLHGTPATPERRRPAKGASLVAGSAQEVDLKAWTARFQGPIGEVIPLTTVQALPREPIMSSEHHCTSSRLTLPVQKSDEEVELCWPLSKETSGSPGPELEDFKRFHHRVWKMFESAEDLMTDEYLEILRQRDRDALSRLLCKHLFNNADTETKSKIRYALIERALADTTNTSPVLSRKLLDAPRDYLSVMELGHLCTPSPSRSLKRNHATVEAEDGDSQGPKTPTRPVKKRKLIKTPQLARQWERRDGRGIYPPSDDVAQWCIDTRKGGRYEHLSCFTSASFPIKSTLATKVPELRITKPQGPARLPPTVAITDSSTSNNASTALPGLQPSKTARPLSRPSMMAPRTTLADTVKLRKRACAKRRPIA